jgi:light-regulated signal transduction histidine kinase (bacteriophytochrome)
LTRRVAVDRSDEIGELARDFNNMTQRLVDANAGLELKVKERTVELERSNADLAQFAYIASHDLREPLRMVTCYVQMLEARNKEQLDEEAQTFIGYAVDGATRMRRLIDDLLAFSRVGTKGKKFVEVDTGEILAAAKMNLKMAIDESGAELVCGELPKVMGDPTQLLQLCQNLIANAIKFRGDRTPRVEVGAKHEDGRWHFSIRDNGIGIEESHCERIFLIFQRLHQRGEYEGPGIGLAVCKKIVERHGGKIRVESVPGEGSTFIFCLPVFEEEAALAEEREALQKDEAAEFAAAGK